MQAIDIQFFFRIAILLVLAFSAARTIRFYVSRKKAADWPVVTATIQKAEAVINPPAFRFAGTRGPESLFGYCYTVDGQRYFGFFAVAVGPQNRLDGYSWQASLDGKSITVRYNPQHPEKSFVVDREIEGKEIHQGPDWVP